jgi:hypothetical protein
MLRFALLARRGRVEGFELKEMIGFRWRLLFPDFIWGLVWSLLLGGLLLIGIFLVLFVLHGAEALPDPGAI